MAVSIDNVYQKVLALANKEQRGYVTPQEFNLLADKAQNDIFEMYFHEYKTSLLSPGNQSKTADDIDMLREKISIHRVVGGEVSSAGVLPTNTHWLESVYDGQDFRTVELTFAAASSIADDTDFIALRAIYDGTGTAAAGEATFLVRFDTSNDGVGGTHIISGTLVVGDLSGADAASVTGKFINAINDNDPYHTAALKNGSTTTAILTYKQLGITGSEAKLSTGVTMGAVSAASDPVVYEEVDKDDWMYIKSNKRLSPSKTSRGMFYRKNATTIGVLPVLSTAIQCDYIQKPAKPNWGYVVVGDKALYNSNASTDFDLHASEESTLTNKILELAGIVINKPGLSEVILRNEAVKEANENK